MKRKAFIQLLEKYREGTATEAERKFIELYYELFETRYQAEDQFAPGEEERIKQTILDEIWETIQQEGSKDKKIKVIRWIRPVKIAAAVLIVVATGILIYQLNNQRHNEHHNLPAQKPEQISKNKIRPGGNRAILTLANGAQIVLDSVQNGSLAMQGNTKIIKLNSGLLSYNRRWTTDNPSAGLLAKGQFGPQAGSGQGKQREIQYNTITTPRGGQYEVMLSDGSKVWLNAASSLRFPTAFTGKERRVEMTGEIYFEVEENSSMPFVVELPPTLSGDGRGEIKVLGTHFNVNAYNDENVIKTTLVEGAVRVSNGDVNKTLEPGQQALLDKQTGNMLVKKVNVDKFLAWKNNLFYFENTNIKDIMRQVARWYNVDVIYATKQLKNKNFSGVTSRYKNVDELLKRMELTGTIHFKVKERTITVMD